MTFYGHVVFRKSQNFDNPTAMWYQGLRRNWNMENALGYAQNEIPFVHLYTSRYIFWDVD